jgi:hypothetical protein
MAGANKSFGGFDPEPRVGGTARYPGFARMDTGLHTGLLGQDALDGAENTVPAARTEDDAERALLRTLNLLAGLVLGVSLMTFVLGLNYVSSALLIAASSLLLKLSNAGPSGAKDNAPRAFQLVRKLAIAAMVFVGIEFLLVIAFAIFNVSADVLEQTCTASWSSPLLATGFYSMYCLPIGAACELSCPMRPLFLDALGGGQESIAFGYVSWAWKSVFVVSAINSVFAALLLRTTRETLESDVLAPTGTSHPADDKHDDYDDDSHAANARSGLVFSAEALRRTMRTLASLQAGVGVFSFFFSSTY